jgi:hypothetical protein
MPARIMGFPARIMGFPARIMGFMTMLGWRKHPEPDEDTKDRMVLLQDDPSKKIYEVDGQQMMHNLITGEWFIFEEPADSEP